MPYALVAYFDQAGESRIRALWQLLAENAICDYLQKSDNKPHIKLFMTDEIDRRDAEQAVKDLCRRIGRFKVHFKNYGIYPNADPIIFLDIAANREILVLQQEVYALFRTYRHDVARDFFEEGIYKPDCFLTISIENEKALKGMSILLNEPLPFNGIVASIGLIEFHPAKRLFEHSLS